MSALSWVVICFLCSLLCYMIGFICGANYQKERDGYYD